MKKEKKPPPPAAASPRKMSMKEKRELEAIPPRIDALETEQRALQAQLADFTQCQKPGFVAQSKTRLAEIEKELSGVLARWEELEALSAAGNDTKSS